MNRVVFQLAGAVDSHNEPYVALSLEEPPDAHAIARPFGCRIEDQVFLKVAEPILEADSVRLAGCHLFAAVSQHPEVAQHLNAALVSQEERFPVYVEIEPASGAEAFPWEALCFPDGTFAALDEKIALIRQVKSLAPPVDAYVLRPPIRVAAILSCLGIPATEELAALREVAQSLPPGQVELMVVSSETELVEGLAAEMEAGTAPEVARLHLMPDSVGALGELVVDFKAHFLHFFCHGSLAGQPHLQLALKDDWEKADPGVGLTVEAAQFQRLRKKAEDKPWVVVLNCCEGAAPDPRAQAHSLALALAFLGVAPVAVGMREPVTDNVASLLTRAFYRTALGELGRRLDDDTGVARPVDWAKLATRARASVAAELHQGLLLSQAAASTKEWTLPAVYVRPQEFRVQAMVQDLDEQQVKEARLEIAALRMVLKALPAGQGLALRAEAQARIAELAAQVGVDVRSEDGDDGVGG